jgi:hypothetical protein
MADGTGGGGGAAMGVVVGALLAGVLVVGFFAVKGGMSDTHNINLNVHAPSLSAPAAPGK